MKLTRNALLTISIILLSSLTACSQNTKPSTSTKWDASPVIQEMNKQAFIDHPEQWKEITQKYNYGKKIHSLKILNQVLYTGNKHASAVNSMNDFENIHYPKLTSQDNLKIINIPSFYSLNSTALRKTKYTKPMYKLTRKERLHNILCFQHHLQGSNAHWKYPRMTRTA